MTEKERQNMLLYGQTTPRAHGISLEILRMKATRDIDIAIQNIRKKDTSDMNMLGNVAELIKESEIERLQILKRRLL